MGVQQCAREFLNPGTPWIVGRWNNVFRHLTKIDLQETAFSGLGTVEIDRQI